jgi:uncharacterized protein YjbI with pentapeptide repeats
MKMLLKFIRGVVVIAGGITAIASLLFAAFQLYLERRVGVIEMKGHAWELSGANTSNDLAIKWALGELAPCYDLDGVYYIPKIMYKEDYRDPDLDEFIGKHNGNWLKCRYGSFSFSHAVIQNFSIIDGMFCPSSKGEKLEVLDWLHPRRGLSVSNSYFLCVSFSQSHLAKMSARGSVFIGSSFSGAELVSSEWNDSDLRYVFFDYSDLRGAQFRRTKLQGANFEKADLEGATFVDTALNGAENFDGANVTRANLSGLQGLTDEQLSHVCVQEGGNLPVLPRYLAGREALVKKCQ